MTAQIINLSDYRPAITVHLVWRKDGRRWLLTPSHDRSDIWAVVERYGDSKRCGRGIFAKPTAKATCCHPDLASPRTGEPYWVLGSNAGQAKRRIISYIRAHRNTRSFILAA